MQVDWAGVTPEQLREVVAGNIRRLAEQKDLGLNALADLSGVGRTQLYDVLAGRKAATTDWLAKVCVTLGVEAYVLLRPMPNRTVGDGT